MDPSILGKLVGKKKLLGKETTKLIRVCVDQLLEKFERPGAIGATRQWCNKLISLYPVLADEGESMNEKTVQ